ncbi:MAG: lipid-A-disaccharide synthase [Gemmataceae bacterium]
MRVFISAGEPSGDMHGANLIRRLRERHPQVEVTGFGGDRMTAAGADLVFPLCNFAVMGLGAVIKALPTFLRLHKLAKEEFAKRRPDVLVLIDYPGYHWWLAGAAKKAGIPVCYFVPPQIWGWARWRVHKLRRLTDRVLSSLPFEHDFFAEHGVQTELIGHPYFDELAQQRLDGDFMAAQRRQPGTIVAMLPGSRKHELDYNVPSLIRAAQIIHAKRPDVRFLAGCLKPHQADHVRQQLQGTNLPVEVHIGRTAEIIQLAHSCLAVSGSISLEMLHRGKPAAILYRVFWTTRVLGKMLLKAKYITLVNLLADRMIYPEYISTGCLGEQLAGNVLHWLQDRAAYEEVCGQLATLRARFGMPGACDRAVQVISEMAAQGSKRLAA